MTRPAPLPICNDHQLLLPGGLASLTAEPRADMVQWLEFHGLDPDQVSSTVPLLRNGPWLVWSQINRSRRAFELGQMLVKCQCKIEPLPFPESVRVQVEAQRRAVLLARVDIDDLPDGA